MTYMTDTFRQSFTIPQVNKIMKLEVEMTVLYYMQRTKKSDNCYMRAPPKATNVPNFILIICW